jgi:DNA polymerase III subunit delta
MSVRLPASRLLPATHACYFLSGGDEDGVFESAETLLADAADGATLLRVDVNELALIHENLQPGLFGEVRCHAMVRNAGSASPKQIEQLEKLAAQPPAGLRLVICAPGVDGKKAVYKRISALPEIVCCTLDRMDESAFTLWLAQVAAEAGLQLDEGSLALMSEHLSGMRMAARQAVERLRLYAGEGEGPLGVEVIGELLGERSPADLADLCHAVGERSPRAIGLLRKLLREQQVAEVQVHNWISMRLQQLLLYAWYAASDRQGAARQAGLFGDSRQLVPREAACWKPAELMRAMARLVEVEMLLKGTSTENKDIVLERFVLDLLAG